MCKPDDYPAVQQQVWDWDRETQTRAQGIVTSLQKFINIVAFIILKSALDYIKGLAAKLQKRHMEVYEAYLMVDRVISKISRVRNNIEEQFNMWYEEAKALADVVDSSEEKPRTTRHQRRRGNMPAESTAEYYKRAFAIPFIDELLQHLRDRFSEENRAIVSIFSIMPALIISSVDPQGQTEHMKPWEADLPSPMPFPNELQRWKLYWIEKREAGATIPDNLKSSIAHADEDVFPNIRVLLILAVLCPSQV